MVQNIYSIIVIIQFCEAKSQFFINLCWVEQIGDGMHFCTKTLEDNADKILKRLILV